MALQHRGFVVPSILLKLYLTNGEHGAWEYSMISTTWVREVYDSAIFGKSVDVSLGGLIAAGITYGTANMDSTWAWRIPSAIQGIFSILCIAILPFIPESPRWLIYQDRPDEALLVIAQTYVNGDASAPLVIRAYREILDTITYEKVCCPIAISVHKWSKFSYI